MYGNLALLAGFVLVYSIVAGRMQRSLVGGAIAFTAFGLLFGPEGLGFLQLAIQSEGLRLLAELALALVLFTDAANVEVLVLRRSLAIPARLLLVGLPMTIVLGIVAGAMIFDHLDVLEVAILATILAPTDAALGKAVVTNPAVPSTVRSSLNVESGLNDGICVPIVLMLLVLATEAAVSEAPVAMALMIFGEELGIGLVVGVACTALTVPAVRFALTRGWTDPVWLQFTVPALALLCFGAAQASGGSGFIASFVGGLATGALIRHHKHAILSPAEGIGETLALLTWVVFGAVVIGQARDVLSLPVVLYALLSLTLIRMVPVFLSLTGTGLSSGDKLFIGWFGPRGLASIVFTIIVLNEGITGGGTLAATAVWTIVLSVVAHGLTAGPLAAAFAKRDGSPSTG
jgi:sodium/hydrogen antiporter